MKRILALVMVAIMVLGVFTACDVDITCVHEDEDANHRCDVCGERLSFCYDNNNDHVCEYCLKTMSKCSDSNKDHLCDVCAKALSECKNEDGDHTCDICGVALSECVDDDKNHTCDSCGEKIADCADINNDHKCDVCGIKLSSCKNENGDHNCDLCGATMSICSDSDKDHICNVCNKTLSACADASNDHLCDYCGAKISECVDSDYNGECDVCKGEVEIPAYIRDGDKITFGSYPQSEVTDSSLISTLNSKAGTLPTSSDSQAWTSYGYYISGNVSNFMWYIDVEQGGEKYRGVYFTFYRPYYTTTTSSNTYQDNNGYTTSTVYWFKYEPISWTILSENTTDGTALILCDMIIDSQEYYITDSGTRTIDGKTVYPNNYAHSTIRKWLNETFYNTAFSELQQQIILTTTVDNSAASTGYSSNSYACENTQDKIFLLSAQEVRNTAYGFASSTSTNDTARIKKTTDYAQAQGAYTSTSTDYAGNGRWWLRSPNYYNSNAARDVNFDGYVNRSDRANDTSYGVVPALWIQL